MDLWIKLTHATEKESELSAKNAQRIISINCLPVHIFLFTLNENASFVKQN